jgi:hypothetical protein
MDPLQNEIWSHVGHMTEGVGQAEPTPAATAPEPPLPPSNGDASDKRQPAESRRRFGRGGRRRSDWPEDAGLTCCPGCGHENLQSLGALDSGDYLWQCPRCDRRFQTGRATRTML